MRMMLNNAYEQYKTQMQKVADLKYAAAVLQWDEETYMPAKGAANRARQIATLSEQAHVLGTEASLGKLLQDLLATDRLTASERRNVELSWEDYSKQLKYSSAFVRKMSETVSTSFHFWVEARKQNDFRVFEPWLEQLVDLKKQEAHLLGFGQHIYDALLNEYEKGATVSFLDQLFEGITVPIQKLLLEIQSLPKPDTSFLRNYYAKEQQWEWGMYLVQQLGFDLTAGRQDISEHPFTTNFSARDVRITTRIDEHDLANMTWSCIHEVGHGLYEQGLPDDAYGLPLGEYASLSIHESQSRLWENNVGRSKAFWKFYLPKLQEFFPEALANIDLDRFYRAINMVHPSLIRTEADELTYHLHVKIRYEIEKGLLDGSIRVKDVPYVWNEQYKQQLGVIVPDDKRGCLQDVHWSHGSFGYFPTYSLGSFYAAQFFETASEQIADLTTRISQGQLDVLLDWLRKNIHSFGRTYTSEELCRKVTGDGLNVSSFIHYLTKKIEDLK